MLDPTLVTDMRNPTLRDNYIHDFFVIMAICNTVVVSRNGDVEDDDSFGVGIATAADNGGQLDPQAIVYEAESPDEAALVEVSTQCLPVSLSIMCELLSNELLAFVLFTHIPKSARFSLLVWSTVVGNCCLFRQVLRMSNISAKTLSG